MSATGTLPRYRFVVIFARYQEQWLYVRQRTRETWETPGGHVEPGETPEAAARRELWEETGAVDFTIEPIFDYAVYTPTEFSYGQVFLAHIGTLGELPPYEIGGVRQCTGLPDPLTYPDITPVLYERVLRN